MPLSPTGQFTLPNGYLAVTGQDVLPSNHNPPLEDIANVLSEAFYRTGVAPMLAPLNFNTFKGINLADGTAAVDAVNKGQLDAVAAAAAAALAGLITVTNINSAYQIKIPSANIMVQFGQSARTTNAIDGTAQIDFPVPFSNTPQAVMATNATATGYMGHFVLFPTWTASAFSLKTDSPLALSAQILVTWLAIGQST